MIYAGWNPHKKVPPFFIGGFTTSFFLIFRALYGKNSMGETPYAKNFWKKYINVNSRGKINVSINVPINVRINVLWKKCLTAKH